MIDIEKLKPQIIEALMPLKPDKIILFGSYAYGTPNEDSDITAVELHYSVEKILKAFLAYENKKIPKSHDLVTNYINLEDDVALLKQITKYHIEESYPVFDRKLPSREEIKEVLEFSEELSNKVCRILEIDKKDVMR